MHFVKRYTLQLMVIGVFFFILLSVLPGYARETKNTGQGASIVKKQLMRAIASSPENYAARYYLGILHLREGNRDEAISQWEAFLALAPEDSKSVSVREQLTVLKIEQAREFARNALKESPEQAAITPPPANTIAVLDFKNLGTDELVPFIKGLTAMVITDISKVPDLKVVERARMQALMDEMKLAQIGVVDPQTAAKIGQILQARTIEWGELGASGDSINIGSTLSDTVSHTKLGDAEVKGLRKNFFELEKQLVFDMLELLGIKQEELDKDVVKALKKVHTQNYDALISYGKGLDFLDRGNYSQAKESFETAATIDPGFDLADTAEKSTPVTEMTVTTFVLEPVTEEPTEEPATEEPTEEPATEESTGEAATEETTEEAATDEPTDEPEIEDAPKEEVPTIDPETPPLEGPDAGPLGPPDMVPDDPFPIPEPPTDLPPQEDIVEDPYPTLKYGYFTNMLRNTAGRYHGTYYTGWKQDLSGNWTAISTWPAPSEATGNNQTISSLVVVDAGDPITTGIPNDITWTKISHNEYMVWGHWNDTDEMVRQSDPPAPSGHYVFNSKGYYIYGDHTNSSQWTALTSSDIDLIYEGNAYGTYSDTNGTDDTMTGTFAAEISIFGGSADVRDFDLSITSNDHSAEILNGTGTVDGGEFELFSGTASIDSNAVDAGAEDLWGLSGALYGSTGQAIGGVFVIEDNDPSMDPDLTKSVHGMFQGSIAP